MQFAFKANKRASVSIFLLKLSAAQFPQALPPDASVRIPGMSFTLVSYPLWNGLGGLENRSLAIYDFPYELLPCFVNREIRLAIQTELSISTETILGYFSLVGFGQQRKSERPSAPEVTGADHRGNRRPDDVVICDRVAAGGRRPPSAEVLSAEVNVETPDPVVSFPF